MPSDVPKLLLASLTEDLFRGGRPPPIEIMTARRSSRAAVRPKLHCVDVLPQPKQPAIRFEAPRCSRLSSAASLVVPASQKQREPCQATMFSMRLPYRRTSRRKADGPNLSALRPSLEAIA
jgi:hypothetical protein